MKAISRAIAAAGSQAELARRIGKTEQELSRWARRGFASSKYAAAIETATGICVRDLIADQHTNPHAPIPTADRVPAAGGSDKGGHALGRGIAPTS